MKIKVMKLVSNNNETIVEHFYESEQELLVIENYKQFNLPKAEFNKGIKELRDYLLTPDGIDLKYLMLISELDTDEFKDSSNYLKSIGLDITNYLL